MKAEQHRFVDPEPRARHAQFLDAQRAKIVDGADRRVRFARLAVGGAGDRHASALLAPVRQRAAVKDLIVGMSDDRE
jgi:hypothetical protein